MTVTAACTVGPHGRRRAFGQGAPSHDTRNGHPSIRRERVLCDKLNKLNLAMDTPASSVSIKRECVFMRWAVRGKRWYLTN